MNPDSQAAKSRLEGRWGLMVAIIIVAIFGPKNLVRQKPEEATAQEKVRVMGD